MVHGLAQIKEMNDNAVRIHLAIKAGILPPETLDSYQMTEREVSLFEGDSQLIAEWEELTR